jgi:transposase-like protein
MGPEQTGNAPRRHYDEPFKRQVIQRFMKSGESVSSFAASIGIDRTNLQKWKKIYGPEVMAAIDGADGKTIGPNEFNALKKEINSLKETVDKLRAIVKKSLVSRYTDLE